MSKPYRHRIMVDLMPNSRRRGIHTLISVSMLIGFTIVMAGILLVVLSEYGAISTNNTECALSGVSIYDVGDRAYFVMTLHNIGSNAIISANVTFIDDSGIEHGFANDSLSIVPGGLWSDMGSFSASVSDQKYVTKASIVSDEGSITRCVATG